MRNGEYSFVFRVLPQSCVAKCLYAEDCFLLFIFLDVSGFLPAQRKFVLSQSYQFFAYLTACKLEVASYCSKLATVAISLGEPWVAMYASSVATLDMLVLPKVTVYP